MAAKKTAAGFDFLVSALKANKGALYSDLKEKAEAKGLIVYPVMFGRAKAMLGLVKSKKRGEGKAQKATAGKPGRPQDGSSKSGQIRQLLSTGKSAAEIAKQVGCSVNLVYAVKASSKRAAGRGQSKAARAPARAAVAGGSIDTVVAALRENDRERERLMRAMQQIRTIIESLV